MFNSRSLAESNAESQLQALNEPVPNALPQVPKHQATIVSKCSLRTHYFQLHSKSCLTLARQNNHIDLNTLLQRYMVFSSSTADVEQKFSVAEGTKIEQTPSQQYWESAFLRVAFKDQRPVEEEDRVCEGAKEGQTLFF